MLLLLQDLLPEAGHELSQIEFVDCFDAILPQDDNAFDEVNNG